MRKQFAEALRPIDDIKDTAQTIVQQMKAVILPAQPSTAAATKLPPSGSHPGGAPATAPAAAALAAATHTPVVKSEVKSDPGSSQAASSSKDRRLAATPSAAKAPAAPAAQPAAPTPVEVSYASMCCTNLKLVGEPMRDKTLGILTATLTPHYPFMPYELAQVGSCIILQAIRIQI